jgi:hypothetical protein
MEILWKILSTPTGIMGAVTDIPGSAGVPPARAAETAAFPGKIVDTHGNSSTI